MKYMWVLVTSGCGGVREREDHNDSKLGSQSYYYYYYFYFHWEK